MYRVWMHGYFVFYIQTDLNVVWSWYSIAGHYEANVELIAGFNFMLEIRFDVPILSFMRDFFAKLISQTAVNFFYKIKMKLT